MSEFQDLFMLSDVAAQNQEPIANAETMFGLSDSVNFGSSMRNSQDAAATAWAGIRPDTACTTPRNPSPRDTNETRWPHDVSALAADVAESTGNSVPSNEVLLQNTFLVMQSLAGALQNSVQAAPQSARPRVKLDMPSYSGYHDSKSANEYLDRLLHYQQATGLTDAELLTRVVPVSLTEQAARWFRLAGHRARTRCQLSLVARGTAVRPPHKRVGPTLQQRSLMSRCHVVGNCQTAHLTLTPTRLERPTTPPYMTLHVRIARPTRDQVCGPPRSGEAMTHQFAASNARAGPLAAEESAQDQTERPQPQPRYDLRNRRKPCTHRRMEQGNCKRRCRSERRLTALTHQQRRRSRENRRQRAAPAQHESFASTERRCPATTSRRRPVPAQPTSVDQPHATEPPGCSHQNVSTWTRRRSESRRIGGAAAQRGSPGHDAKVGPGSGLCQLAPPGRHQQPEWRGLRRGDPNHRSAEASRENGGNTGASRDNGNIPEPGATTAATTARSASATAAGATAEAAKTVPAVATEAAAMQVGLLATPTAEPTEVQEDMARDTSCLLLLKDDVRFT
ncbi:hypothetical protein HPB50_007289 [Hyalomma asiaticum]|uniref:Uncharacterized protein n=1 Tax=Hyalomma asiaticum TaxID=266040 RepID=A0ACB7TFT6_HYAAI|nr:hypothetical protein HPB50_007289 [Hyalomma asiaticum]